MWEFDRFIKGDSPNGHSVTQRFEFWKAAWGIASSHFIIGVGTGDMPASYQQQYDLMKSSLDSKHRLRAHNQYLAILVAFGIPGLLYFLYAIFYPLITLKRNIGFLFAAFFLICFMSMFSEDTLETQAGATFFALFFALTLLRSNKE
jgi:O-antigen ligase